MFITALDPHTKLNPYRNNPRMYQKAREELINIVCF
jgi:hypothetical protein